MVWDWDWAWCRVMGGEVACGDIQGKGWMG